MQASYYDKIFVTIANISITEWNYMLKPQKNASLFEKDN